MLEAKDTVLQGRVTQELKISWTNTITGHLLGWQPELEATAQDKFDEFIRLIRLEQAEITWNLAIREMVKWMRQEGIAIPEWKLEEWGI